MAKLQLREISQSQLDTVPIQDGQLIFAFDTGRMYKDGAKTRNRVAYAFLPVDELPLAPINETMYYCDGSLSYYDGEWHNLTEKITKESLGLDKVDNTADSDKSVKYAESAGGIAGIDVSQMCFHEDGDETVEEQQTTCDYIDGGAY